MAWFRCGGGGITSDEVTATRADVLTGKTALTSDSGDEVATGTMPSYSDSGNVNLNNPGDSKSYPSGYYPNAHGAVVNISWYTDLS